MVVVLVLFFQSLLSALQAEEKMLINIGLVFVVGLVSKYHGPQ